MNLVTGASGFIGSSVVRRLLARGQKVRCYVEPGAKLDNLNGLDVEIVTGDVNDRDGIARALDGCDTLYHLAAIYAIWLRDPSLMYRVNVEGGKTVLWAAYKRSSSASSTPRASPPSAAAPAARPSTRRTSSRKR